MRKEVLKKGWHLVEVVVLVDVVAVQQQAHEAALFVVHVHALQLPRLPAVPRRSVPRRRSRQDDIASIHASNSQE